VGALLIRLSESFVKTIGRCCWQWPRKSRETCSVKNRGSRQFNSGPLTFLSAERLSNDWNQSRLKWPLAERRFGAHALSESSDGLAVAYLDARWRISTLDPP